MLFFCWRIKRSFKKRQREAEGTPEGVGPAHLQSLGHDAAHDGADSQRGLHVQLTEGGFELVDGDQPGSDGWRCRAEQVQLSEHTTENKAAYSPRRLASDSV